MLVGPNGAGKSTLVRAIAQGEDDEAATELVKSSIASGNLPMKLLHNIRDDTTVLVLVRFDPKPQRQPLEYYQPPDWGAISQWVRQRMAAVTADEVSVEPADATVDKEEIEDGDQ